MLSPDDNEKKKQLKLLGRAEARPHKLATPYHGSLRCGASYNKRRRLMVGKEKPRVFGG